MFNKKLTSILLGGLIFLVAIYSNSFSQEIQKENVYFTPKVTSPTDSCIYKPGDGNRDNKVNLADIFFMVNCIFKNGCGFVYPTCLFDVNADRKWTLADAMYLVNFLFRGGPAPVKSGVCCL